MGAYVQGTNDRVDKAIKIYDDLCNLLKQDQDLSENIGMESLFGMGSAISFMLVPS